MVLDEPNANLDSAGETALVGAVRHLKEIGSTVIFVTHKTNMLTLADKVLLMEQGAVRLYGEREEVVAKIFGGPKAVAIPAATACRGRTHARQRVEQYVKRSTRMANLPNKTSDDPRVYAWIGYAIIVFSFVVLGGWAAITPLGSAVVASGFVTTEGNKKTIQHLEGGILKEILIREGQHVEAGRSFCEWTIRRPKQILKSIRNQLYAAVARETRLAAELDGSETFNFQTS